MTVSRPRAEAPDHRPPNIITVVLDCARAKNFSMNGATVPAQTPVLNSLARVGTIFPRAVAPSNWTLPSHFSMFTGTYPTIHGVRTFQRASLSNKTTAASLRAHGYETALFTENVHLVGGYGLENGFDERFAARIGISEEEKTVVNAMFDHAGFLRSRFFLKLVSRIPPLIAPLSYLFHTQEVAFKNQVCTELVVKQFTDWLGRRQRTAPFYAFINLVDTHDPYEVIPNGDRISRLGRAYLMTPRFYLLAVPGLQSRLRWSALVRGYIQSIQRADQKLGRILAALDNSGERERTMIIVTSDHGQSFGEGGNAFHGCGATDSVTRVPLVVAPPSGVGLPKKIERWTSLCEIDAWSKSAALGILPFDDSGLAPEKYRGPHEPGIVYCEGAPASDVIRSLRGVSPEQSWNRRLLAAYHDETKHVLDIESGEVWEWDTGSDSDLVPGRCLDASSRAAVRQAVFDPYEEAGHLQTAGAPTASRAEVSISSRLRSWGYE